MGPGELQDLRKREAEQKVDADWEIDAFMTADTVQGKKEAIVSEYILRILGLEVSISTLDLLDAYLMVTILRVLGQ